MTKAKKPAKKSPSKHKKAPAKRKGELSLEDADRVTGGSTIGGSTSNTYSAFLKID